MRQQTPRSAQADRLCCLDTTSHHRHPVMQGGSERFVRMGRREMQRRQVEEVHNNYGMFLLRDVCCLSMNALMLHSARPEANNPSISRPQFPISRLSRRTYVPGGRPAPGTLPSLVAHNEWHARSINAQHPRSRNPARIGQSKSCFSAANHPSFRVDGPQVNIRAAVSVAASFFVGTFLVQPPSLAGSPQGQLPLRSSTPTSL